MKILYAIHQFYPETSGGTEHFLLNLAHAQQRVGHRVDIVAYTQADLAEGDRASPLQRRDYIHERLPVTTLRHPRSFLELNTAPRNSEIASFAREYLREGAYDLLHVVHPMRVASFATAAAGLGVPYVVTLTDFWTLCPKITLQTSYGSLCSGPEDGRACTQFCPELPFEHISSRLAAIHSMLRGASAVITPSEFAAALVRKQYPDIAVTVVPHGLNRSNFSYSAKIYASGSTIVFGYCGGLAPHKGVHLLVSAFRRVANGNVSLRIFGAAGPSDKAYERELRKLAAGDQRIEFRGPYRPDEAGRVFQFIDVLVIPSLWYETYSLSLQEAFACGVPVIASEIGVLAEKIKAGENGLTFRIGEENDLKQQLRLTADEPELLNSFKQNLKAFVPHMEEEEGYSHERIYQLALAGLNASGT